MAKKAASKRKFPVVAIGIAAVGLAAVWFFFGRKKTTPKTHGTQSPAASTSGSPSLATAAVQGLLTAGGAPVAPGKPVQRNYKGKMIYEDASGHTISPDVYNQLMAHA